MIRERLFSVFTWLVALSILSLLLWIVTDVLLLGFGQLNWSFLTDVPKNSGREGGIVTILISSFIVLLGAMVVAVPLGIAIAIWLAEFVRSHEGGAGNYIRMSLIVLAGVPSIVFGLFGNAFFCIFLGLGFSLLSGSLTLACMILPIFITTCETGIREVREEWRLGAYAVGMNRTSTLFHILLPAAAPAITAGLLLGTGRATAETAALIFTSGYVDRMPESLLDSGRVLAVHIYDLTMNVPGGDGNAYASALVLLAVICIINVLAVLSARQWQKRKLCC